MQLTIDATERAQAINLLELSPVPITTMTVVQQRRWEATGRLLTPDGNEPAQIIIVHTHPYSLRGLFVDMEANAGPRGAGSDQFDRKVLPVNAEKHSGDVDFLYVLIQWGDEEVSQTQAILPPEGMAIVEAEVLIDLDEEDEESFEIDTEVVLQMQATAKAAGNTTLVAACEAWLKDPDDEAAAQVILDAFLTMAGEDDA